MAVESTTAAGAGNGAAADERPAPRAYYVFVLLALLYFFDYADRMVVSSLFPFIKADWKLSDAQLGLLVSAVYWSILACAFPVALLVDRWSRRKAIAVMAVLWSLATAASMLTRSFGQLLATRLLVGIGEAGYAPGGTALVAALFPRARRAAMLGLWNAAIPLGAAFGIALGGLVATHWGWRHAFGLVALPGLAVALLFFFTPDYKSVALNRTAADGARVRLSRAEVVREITGRPSLLLTYVAFAGNTFVTTGLLTWLPSYFGRIDGSDQTTAGFKAGMVMLGAMLGAPLGGLLADRWQRRNPRARLHFAALSSAATFVTFSVAFALATGPLRFGLLILGGVLAAMFVAAAAAVTQDVVHTGLRATAYSVCVVTQNLLGSSLGPLVVGVLADRWGLDVALALLPLGSLLAALLFALASRFYERDLARVEQVRVEFE